MKRFGKLMLLVFAFGVLTFSMAVCSAPNASALEAPRLTRVSNCKHGLKVKWKKLSGVDGYIIYRRTDGSSKWKKVVVINDSKTTSYVDKTVKSSVGYTYTMKAFAGKKKSPSSNRFSRMYSAVPKITSLKNVKNGVAIKWKKIPGALEYCVYRKGGNTDWKKLAAIGSSTSEFIDKKAKSGVKYTYQVRQICSNAVSAKNANIRTITFVSAPKVFDATASKKGISLKWNGVSGANGYAVYRKTKGEKKWTKIKTVGSSSRSWIDKTAPKGKTSRYRLKTVVVSKPVSAYSATVSAKRFDEKKKMVALTFDDGPYRPVTNQILDVLKKYDSRATFFVVGSRVSTYSDCVKRAVSLNCEIGNHTYNHTTLTSVSDARVRMEIADANAAIRRYAGAGASLVRAPGGSVNGRVLSLVPYPFINWSVDTLDWSHRSTSKTVQKIKENVKDGSIVLMHDLYYSTGDATKIIVPWLVKQGYQLVTVSEMMEYKGIKLKPGSVYTQAR